MLKIRLNLRKVATIVICLAVTTIFSGCDDKEKQPEIKVENEASCTQTVYADQTEGKSGITIVTAGAWTSSITEGTVKSAKAGTVLWLNIDPSSGGAGEHTISINLEPNTTGEDRTAIIAITCGDTEITISVTQKGTKEDGEPYVPVKLLEKETRSGEYINYEYDAKNRLTKWSFYWESGVIAESFTFTYDDNDLIKFVYDYHENDSQTTYNIAKNGNNKITITSSDRDDCTIDLNSDGYPIKVEYISEDASSSLVLDYQYQGDNLIKFSSKEIWSGGLSERSNNYKYDTKKSPFYQCKTPKWFMFFFIYELGSANNVTEDTFSSGGKATYTYVFDSDGYPTKRTEKHVGGDDSGREFVTTYQYK